MRKVVLLDVDDTLIDFVGPLVPFIHKNYPALVDRYQNAHGEIFSRDSFHEYDLKQIFGCSLELERKIIGEF